MITLHDLDEAITECLGQRNPNANTCIKLAAFYTLKDHMFEEPKSSEVSYSFAPPAPQVGYVEYNGDSEFARAINGLDSDTAWDIMDELMNALSVANPRLYAGVMRKIDGSL